MLESIGTTMSHRRRKAYGNICGSPDKNMQQWLLSLVPKSWVSQSQVRVGRRRNSLSPLAPAPTCGPAQGAISEHRGRFEGNRRHMRAYDDERARRSTRTSFLSCAVFRLRMSIDVHVLPDPYFEFQAHSSGCSSPPLTPGPPQTVGPGGSQLCAAADGRGRDASRVCLCATMRMACGWRGAPG